MLLAKFMLMVLPLLSTHAAVPRELQGLADQAHSLPPEFSADVLLKLAASPLATDPKWKRRAIEEAFLSAGAAPQPYRKRGDRRVSPGDTLSRGLERLTLQTRAVEAMLPLDRQRALTMFQDIAPPELSKRTCQDALTPDVSAYYEVATTLFTGAFTPGQRRKGNDVQFLQQIVGVVQSASQVVPALKMLDQVELNPDIRRGLIATLVTALDGIDGGDREFAAWEPLLVGSALPEIHETALFLPALRSYIVRHLSGPRCSDQIRTGQLPESANGFNRLISQIDRAGTQFRPIAGDEVAPLRDDGTFKPPTMAQSPQAKRLLAAIGLQAEGVPAARYFEALKTLESWKPEDEASPEDYWFLAAIEYVELVGIAPAGAVQRSAVGNALRFMEQQYDSFDNRASWFVGFGQLIGLAKSDRGGLDRAWVLEQLLHSRNPVISVYAQLEKVLGVS